MKITDIFTFRCQLCHTHRCGDCSCNYSEVLWETIKNNQFHQIIKKTLNDVRTTVFVVFKSSILTSSFFIEFSSNWKILIFYLLLCLGLQTSILGLYLQSNMAAENNGKALKTKFEKRIKTKHSFFLVLEPLMTNMVVRCVICR